MSAPGIGAVRITRLLQPSGGTMLDRIRARLAGRAAAKVSIDTTGLVELRVHRNILQGFGRALEAREPELGVLDHAARVSHVANRIARALSLSEGEQYLLDSAAQLHELGMLTLPPELAGKAGPLSPAELEEVRTQAGVSAQIASGGYHPRIPRLIADQYRDHDELADTVAAGDLLLSGVFRVADVFASVTWPRPYKQPLSAEERTRLLEDGAGTRFHPAAVEAALAL